MLYRPTPGGYTSPVRLTVCTSARGNVFTAVFDARDMIASVDALGNINSLFYDNVGGQTGVQTPLGFLSTTIYDDAGQVSATINPLNSRTTFQYDLAGNRTTDRKSVV